MVGGLVFRTIFTAKKEVCSAVFMIVSVIAVLLIYSGVLFSHHVGGMNVPMLTVGGQYLPDDRVRCFGPINNVAMKQIVEISKDKATLWPFCYYNLQFMYVRMAFDTLYLSVLVVPDEFLGARLAGYMANGRLPEKSALECVAGSDAARAWRIEEGQWIDIELENNLKFEKVEYRQPGARSVKVVGVMSDELNFHFLRGAVLLTQSTFEALYQKPPLYNCFFAYSTSIWSPIEELRRYALENRLCVFRIRYPFLRGGPPLLMMVVMLCAVGMTFQLSASSSLERNLKNVGILTSMGTDRWRVSLIFALADGVVQAWGIAMGLLVSKYIFLLMNLAVMHRGPAIFSTYATHYRFHQPSIAVLVAVLVLSAVVRGVRTAWFLSRISPDDLIRRAKT